jgi:hypothetical protein
MAPNRAAGGTAKMKRKAYEKELRKLQVELSHLQDWVKATGARIILVFEGRDAAGKGGNHQGHHRTSEPTRVSSGGASGAVGSRKPSEDISTSVRRAATAERIGTQLASAVKRWLR